MDGMQINTDFSQVRPNTPGGDFFPNTTDKMGWLVQIIDSGARENSKKTGTLCVLKIVGLDPAQPAVYNQTMDFNINYTNTDQQAQDIGRAELSAIAHVTGVLRVGNTRDLHNKPFRILIRQQKKNPEYQEVYGILDANGNPAGQAGQGPMNAQPAQGGGFGGQGQQTGQGHGPGPGQAQQPPNGGGWNGGAGQGQQTQPANNGGWNGGQGQGQGQQPPQTDPNAGQQQQQPPQNANWNGGQQQQPQGGGGWNGGQQAQPAQGGDQPGWARGNG